MGKIRIQLQTSDELNSALQNLGAEIKAIEEVVIKVSPPPPPNPKPGYETLYRVTARNEVELLRVREKLRAAVAVVLYAYSPNLATSAQIEHATDSREG